MRQFWLMLVAGCYAPQYAPGSPCTTTCPGDLVCVQNTCVPPGTVVPSDAAPDVDVDAPLDLDAGIASTDASMVDASPLGDAMPSDPTLIAHWKFDDSPTNGVLDSTGNGHNGTCTACPSLVLGVKGYAYRFEASKSQYIIVPDAPAFRGTFTIAAWMYATNANMDMAVMSKPYGASTGNSWQLERREAGRVSFSGGSNHLLVSPAPVPAMTWVHVAGSWDGAIKRLYINGQPVRSGASQISYDTHDIYLGADQNSGALALLFDGMLDDLRVYNRALSGDEIAALAEL